MDVSLESIYNMSNNDPTAVAKSQRVKPSVTWQHLWPSDQVKLALTQSPFGKLPTEILLNIFKYLNVHDLGVVSSVCRSFKMIADQDEIWKAKVNVSAKLHSKSFKQIYMDWMHEKYLRNIELEEVERVYFEESSYVACGMRCSPPQYPVRSQKEHLFLPIGEFKQHPNQSQEMTITLSVDVDKTARELISLLKKTSKYKEQWRQSSIIKQMMTRYYRFLQLKSSNPNILLIPTLDIEMIWQTHLLRPGMYREDCLRLFHRVIDHSLILNEVEQHLKEQAFIDTCQLYEERFHEQYCSLPHPEKRPAPKYEHHVFCSLKCLIPIYSYWDETQFTFCSDVSKNYDENPFSFTEADVILDGNWLELCNKFLDDMIKKVPVQDYYRYSDAIDLSTSMLRRLKKSYERFLYMSAKHPPTNGYSFIHPTYAIDIIWHSHMQEPLKYVSDCMRLVGYMIDHAPWPSVDGKQMKEACDDIDSIWKKEFQTEMKTDHLYNTNRNSYDSWDD